LAKKQTFTFFSTSPPFADLFKVPGRVFTYVAQEKALNQVFQVYEVAIFLQALLSLQIHMCE
jgi:hypothetical protein